MAKASPKNLKKEMCDELVKLIFQPLFRVEFKDTEPFHTEHYCKQCEHEINSINSESLCGNSYEKSIKRKQWQKYSVVLPRLL